MAKFAHTKDDGSGHRVVRAISEGSQSITRPQVKSQIQVPDSLKNNHLLGYIVEGDQFREIGYHEKQIRKEFIKTAKIDRIVWCYSDFNYGNSLSHVSRETVRWLALAGIPVVAATWNLVPKDLSTSAVIAMDRVEPPKKIFDILKRAPFVAGYYMLEGSQARGDVISRLEYYDAILTPSEFCQTALKESGLWIPAFVWGHGIDPAVFPLVKKKPNRPFTYLWFGDENRRKGYDLFLKAFSEIKLPNVRAWVRGPGSGIVAKERKKYESDKRIVWDTRVTPPEQMKELMSEADVLVLPFRGEGFGLTPLEAMASGVPAIMTKWSGPLDFGKDDLTYWVKVAGYESSQNDDGVQAIPSMEHLIERMEWCAEHPEDVAARGLKSSQYVHANWTWDKKVREIIPILRQLIPQSNFCIRD